MTIHFSPRKPSPSSIKLTPQPNTTSTSTSTSTSNNNNNNNNNNSSHNNNNNTNNNTSKLTNINNNINKLTSINNKLTGINKLTSINNNSSHSNHIPPHSTTTSATTDEQQQPSSCSSSPSSPSPPSTSTITTLTIPHDSPPSRSPQSIKTGDWVRCTNSMVGICRFIGPIQSKQGTWVGIDLGHQPNPTNTKDSSSTTTQSTSTDPSSSSLSIPTDPSTQANIWYGKGKNSGSVNGIFYFHCEPLCGIFFPLSKVSLFQPQSLPPSPSSLPFPPSPSRPTMDTEPTQTSSPSISSSTLIPPSSPKKLQRHPTTSICSTRSNASTPRPKPRPSLPAPRIPPLTRKPSLPPTTNSNPSTLSRKLALNRKPSSIRAIANSSPNLSNPTDRIPPLTNHRPIEKPIQASIQSHPSANPSSSSTNLLSKSTNQINRSSASYPSSARSSSRSDLKRAESVNSHYSYRRATTPDWARASRHRPKSRLSLAATPDSKSRHRDRSVSSVVDPLLNSTSTPYDPTELQNRINSLEKLVQELELRASESESKNAQSSSQLELQLNQARESLQQFQVDKLQEIENIKQELHQTSQLEIDRLKDESLKLQGTTKAQQDALEKQSTEFEKERFDLQSQLHQLRSAGQSLCGVYENKISDLEQVRLTQLHESQLVAQELQATKQALEELKQAQSHSNNVTNPRSSLAQPIGSAGRLEAVEIDNERLKADLKYTHERLSEFQDEAYQLKQELENQRESHEQIVQGHQETIQQHLLDIKTAKEQITQFDKDRGSLQFKLTQAEARLKETLETMEQERAELEGLRAELLVSHPHSHPKSKTMELDDESPTIVRSGTTESERSEPTMTDHSSNFKYDQLASELKEKQTRIEFLENELNRYSDSNPSKLNSCHDSDLKMGHRPPIIDQEKMLVIQKYQRLLSIKDEENLKLLNKVHDLEDELELVAQGPHIATKSKFNALSLGPPISRSASPADLQLQNPSPRLKHKYSTQSLRTFDSTRHSPRDGKANVSWKSSPNDNHHQAAKELAKATQQIVGLKLIACQSNDERLKFEKANVALKKEIEELKQNNRLLEQKLTKLIKLSRSNFGKHSPMSGNENEDPLNEIKTNENEPADSIAQVIIGDYNKVKKLELEIDQLQAKLANLNQKHGREVLALNREVNELESIIEAKVFEEERLEGRVHELEDMISTLQQNKLSTEGAKLKRTTSKVWRRRTAYDTDYASRPKTSVGPPELNLPLPPLPSKKQNFGNNVIESKSSMDEPDGREYLRDLEELSDQFGPERRFEVKKESPSGSTLDRFTLSRRNTHHLGRRIRDEVVVEEDEEGGRELNELDIQELGGEGGVQEEVGQLIKPTNKLVHDDDDDDDDDDYDDDDDVVVDNERLEDDDRWRYRFEAKPNQKSSLGRQQNHFSSKLTQTHSTPWRREVSPNQSIKDLNILNDPHAAHSSTIKKQKSTIATTATTDVLVDSDLDDARCELCDGVGHQLQDCPVFSGRS